MGDRQDGNEFIVSLTGQKVLFREIDPKRPLVLGQKIGSGTYGDVYKAQIAGDTSEKSYAVKYYREETKSIMHDGIGCTTVRELSALQGCVHPNILKMDDLFLSKHVEISKCINAAAEKWIERGNARPEGYPVPLDQVYVLAAYEYCPGGDVKKILEERKQANLYTPTTWGISLSETKFLVFQLLNGLSFLHNHKMSHRDLKPDNLMLDGQGTKSVLKIGDLGLCREFRSNAGELTPTVCTIYYRPLEVLLGRMHFGEGTEEHDAAGNENGLLPHYGLGVDIWSAGCILAEMILGKPLFKGSQEFDIVTRIAMILGTPTEEEWINCTKLQYYPFRDRANSHFFRCDDKIQHLNCVLYGKLDIQGLDLLSRMLHYNPHLRITAAEALAHSWFSDLNFGYLDGLGIYNWYTDVLKYRIGLDMYQIMEEKDKGCLSTTELAHAICQNDSENPLIARINRCFKAIGGYHRIRRMPLNTFGNRIDARLSYRPTEEFPNAEDSASHIRQTEPLFVTENRLLGTDILLHAHNLAVQMHVPAMGYETNLRGNYSTEAKSPAPGDIHPRDYHSESAIAIGNTESSILSTVQDRPRTDSRKQVIDAAAFMFRLCYLLEQCRGNNANGNRRSSAVRVENNGVGRSVRSSTRSQTLLSRGQRGR
ncbi:putative cell-cycle-associated protein kinase CDK [Cardiosporidium cionae]|uniref:Cyclin-dependent kinase 2 homolog n=1 Tax=Cardiosporidium cionae TaxID=476202 RepID=A0ABQ7J709_9APIC|nr:putative cell-cycle-associated protein kinase CDK [Cardiosporidium cionae]|eukprot:KAF8819770.1 putative cell-cycle-associated protein kinase CDK [Cardiosporidium cionae]